MSRAARSTRPAAAPGDRGPNPSLAPEDLTACGSLRHGPGAHAAPEASGAAAASWGHVDVRAADVETGASAVSPVALVSAAPLVALLAQLEADSARLRTWVPGSDVPAALAAVAGRLRAALRDGAEADVWVTTDEVARLRGLSRSAVTWRINRGRLRAEWRGGRWWVHRADVEAM